MELCDDAYMRATNIYGMSPRKWPELDSLFFKFQGPTPAALKETATIVQRIAKKHGGTGFALAKDDTEAATLWADRKNALYSGMALLEGAKAWSTDVWCVELSFCGYDDEDDEELRCDVSVYCSVPVSRLPDLVYETKKDIEASGIVSTIVGHVGDGECLFSHCFGQVP